MPVHAALPRPTRLLEQSDVGCPAGEVLGGVAVHCSIEKHTIDIRTEPTSVRAYCTGCYRECPSWRAHKEAIWADKERQFDREVVER